MQHRPRLLTVLAVVGVVVGGLTLARRRRRNREERELWREATDPIGMPSR